MFCGHRRPFARQGWQVVAIVHLIDFLCLVATARTRGVTDTRHVAITTLVARIRVVEERRAVALVTILQTKKAHPTDIAAELVAQVRSHGQAILLRDEVVIPSLLDQLRVDDTSYTPEARWAAFGVDVINARKLWDAVGMNQLLICFTRAAH
jgi:hypothetical protein